MKIGTTHVTGDEPVEQAPRSGVKEGAAHITGDPQQPPPKKTSKKEKEEVTNAG